MSEKQAECPFCGESPKEHDGDLVLNHTAECFFTQQYAQEMWLIGKRMNQWNTRHAEPNERLRKAEIVNPVCPDCGKPLQPVTKSPDSYLNSEQFDSIKAGDWFCMTCSNKQDATRHRYFWDHDLCLALSTPPQKEGVTCNRLETCRAVGHHPQCASLGRVNKPLSESEGSK